MPFKSVHQRENNIINFSARENEANGKLIFINSNINVKLKEKTNMCWTVLLFFYVFLKKKSNFKYLKFYDICRICANIIVNKFFKLYRVSW